ncbi:hypothetical protein [Mycobacterium lehmannii]|uniref:hypothetical protein n=1 Tax=Mycobacterium lehmannii TaxID=2048550 RepID=UPI0018E951FB|nr:hypothetical protein [Mycobacterium lehmannii]
MLIPITPATGLDRDLRADRLLTRQGAVGIAVDQRCHGAYGTDDFETGEPMNFTQRKGARNWQAFFDAQNHCRLVSAQHNQRLDERLTG